MYSKVIMYIRKESYVMVKAVYYDRQGLLLKTLVCSGIKKYQGFWTALKIEVENTQDRHRTILEISSIEYNTGMRDSLFRVSTLEKGWLK
jgi:hypothetical protein